MKKIFGKFQKLYVYIKTKIKHIFVAKVKQFIYKISKP